MELRLARDGSLISDKVHFCEENPDHILNRLRTLTNVSYIQPQGRVEWGYEATFLFCDLLPTSTIARYRRLIRQAHRKEWFNFTDRESKTYSVRVAEEPEIEKDEESVEPVYYVTCILVKRGFEV